MQTILCLRPTVFGPLARQLIKSNIRNKRSRLPILDEPTRHWLHSAHVGPQLPPTGQIGPLARREYGAKLARQC